MNDNETSWLTSGFETFNYKKIKANEYVQASSKLKSFKSDASPSSIRVQEEAINFI